MRAALLLLLPALGGCMEPWFVDCGTLICPLGRVCDVENNVCYDPSPGCGNRVVEPELGEVCDDGNTIAGDGCHPSCTATQVCGDGVLDANEVCDDGNATAGDGCHPSCTAFAICGDGVLDPDEVCDDNNNVATDDCSSDCRSTLACGNGLLDVVVGEKCDDGNRTGLDGCDASCAIEQPRWLEVGTPAPPWIGALAYDAARARSVLFVDANTLGVEMWERYGWSWRRLPTQPPAGIDALTFHRVDQEVVGVALGQTFRWDGRQWSPRGGAPARSFVHLLSDGADALFAISNVGEVYDLETSITTPVGRIPAAAGGAFTAGFAPDHALLVRHGGISTVPFGGFPSVQPITHVSADGASWPMAAAGGALANAPAVWDARRQRLLFIGGQPVLGGQTAAVQELDTSSSDPVAWTWQAPTALATAREGGRAAYDIVRAATIVIGGTSGSFPNVMHSTVTEVLDASGWRGEVTTAPNPTRLIEVPERGVAIATTAFNDLWSYNRDQGWIHHASDSIPVTITASPAVFADSSTRTIVWTGSGSTCTIPDDIADPQSTWTCASSTSVVSSRGGAVAAYDTATATGVLFGGQAGVNSPWLGDTYLWRSSAWTAAPAVTIGAGCQRPQLVHDDAASRFLLLCEEIVAATLVPRVWSWTGDTAMPWQREADPPLFGLLVFNRDLRLPMLISPHGVTFLLVNSQWQLQPIEQRRSLPFLVAATYLSADRETIAMNASSMFVLSWESASTEVCQLATDHDGDGLAGCADADCWGRCAPSCFPGSPATCQAAHGCGDGVRSSLETCHSCPQDVGACPVSCGDMVCSPGETGCPGDCGP